MYKYEKSTWINGETILKAEHMQKIEQGIVDLQEELENVKVGDIDLSDYYTKTQTDDAMNTKADKVNTYTKAETDNKISEEIAKAQFGGNDKVDLSNYATKNYVDGEIDAVEGAIALKADQTALDTANQNISKKADTETVNAALDLKADKTQVATDIQNAIAPLAVKTEVDDAIALKADKTSLEALEKTVGDNKTSIEQAVGLKADKTYVDEELAKKATNATTLSGYGITDAYTKNEVDEALLLKASQQDHNSLVDIVNGKANKSETLAGYGITDAYTKDETDNALNLKANSAEVYTKTESDTTFAAKATTLEGYGITDAYTITQANKAIEDALKLATGGESASDVLVALNNYKTENDTRVSNAETRIKALEDAGADDNIIEAIKLAGEATALEITEKTVVLPAATTEKYGLAKLSAEIGADASGALEVKSLNVNKLTQTTGEYLILNGGSAAV